MKIERQATRRLQAFGRTRLQSQPLRCGNNRGDPARFVLIIGCISAALFCANALWRGMKTEVIPSDAVAVMTVTTPGLPADNAPAGFLDGEWSLWEYLSDVLTALFFGG